jgi:hypothetical protein
MSGHITSGNRRPDNTHYIDLAPGEYCLHAWTKPPMWVIRDPAGKLGSLGTGHQVTVHEDGSITVAPSILDPSPGGWHGWLVGGRWQEC